jgi:hypothetical protein
MFHEITERSLYCRVDLLANLLSDEFLHLSHRGVAKVIVGFMVCGAAEITESDTKLAEHEDRKPLTLM